MFDNNTFTKNQIVSVTVTDMSDNGEGIGKSNGYTLFVKDAIVGDTVKAVITKPKKNYAYAKCVEIISPSSGRINPRCENANRCGGCQLQALSYNEQLKFKEGKVRNDLKRLGGFDREYIDSIMEPIVGAGGEDGCYRYRNKAQFPIGQDRNGKIITGFYAGRTHSIIPADDCLIGISENSKILQTVIAYMEKYKLTAYDENTHKGLVRHVLIRKGFNTGQIMVCLVLRSSGKVTAAGADYYMKIYGHPKCSEDEGCKILSVLPHQDELCRSLMDIEGIRSVCVSVNPDNTNVIMGNEIHLLAGSSRISDVMHLRDAADDFTVIEDKSVRFDISALSFYQVNPVQVEKLYSLAIDYASLKAGEEVWDLCCGIGTISLCMAKSTDDIRVHGVEIVAPAIDDARQNAKLNGINNIEFICAPAEEYLPANRESIKSDVIIMDPPRKGMDEAALSTVVEAAPGRIVYVSCNPATLARDLRFLCDRGYELKKVRCVDMFPQTVHVETVVLLSNKNTKSKNYVEISMDAEDYYRIKDLNRKFSLFV